MSKLYDNPAPTGGKPISQFSAAMIGASGHNKFEETRQKFREEAKEITSYIQGVHHSRKNSHNQVYYSSTVEKLSKFQGNIPVTVSEAPPKPLPTHVSKDTTIRAMNEQSFMDNMKSSIASETFMNQRKKLYNREVGRKAVVAAIFNGTAEMPSKVIFPQKATHNQILGMTGSLKAPNPHIIPPFVPSSLTQNQDFAEVYQIQRSVYLIWAVRELESMSSHFAFT